MRPLRPLGRLACSNAAYAVGLPCAQVIYSHYTHLKYTRCINQSVWSVYTEHCLIQESTDSHMRCVFSDLWIMYFPGSMFLPGVLTSVSCLQTRPPARGRGPPTPTPAPPLLFYLPSSTAPICTPSACDASPLPNARYSFTWCSYTRDLTPSPGVVTQGT